MSIRKYWALLGGVRWRWRARLYLSVQKGRRRSSTALGRSLTLSPRSSAHQRAWGLFLCLP